MPGLGVCRYIHIYSCMTSKLGQTKQQAAILSVVKSIMVGLCTGLGDICMYTLLNISLILNNLHLTGII